MSRYRPETWGEYFRLPWYKRWITPIPDSYKIAFKAGKRAAYEDAARMVDPYAASDDPTFSQIAAAIREKGNE